MHILKWIVGYMFIFLKKFFIFCIFFSCLSIAHDCSFSSVVDYECDDEVACYIINICKNDKNLINYFRDDEYGYGFAIKNYYSLNVNVMIKKIEEQPCILFTLSPMLHEMILHLVLQKNNLFSIKYSHKTSPFIIHFSIERKLLKQLVKSIMYHEIAHIVYEHYWSDNDNNCAQWELDADDYVPNPVALGGLLFHLIHIYEMMYIASYKYLDCIPDEYKDNPYNYVQDHYDDFYYAIQQNKKDTSHIHPSHLTRLKRFQKRIHESGLQALCSGNGMCITVENVQNGTIHNLSSKDMIGNI